MREREEKFNADLLHPLAINLAQCFIQRWDIYPQQLDNGSYITIHKPLREEHLISHLQGDITLATYALDPDDKGRFLVIDADDEPDWRRLKAIARAISEIGSEGYLERSRRGGHLWYFFGDSKEGKSIRTFGYGLASHFGIEGIELFPKQDKLKSGPGSSIRLPFGVHRLTGKRYSFYDSHAKVLASTLRDQINLLADPQTVTDEVFYQFYDHGIVLTELEQKKAPPSWDSYVKAEEGESMSDMIKRTIPVRQLVLQYVELSKSGRGLCPFHDDQVESFSVNDDENYWNCFAGCGGGSVIDFWMKLRGCDFNTAVNDLSTMQLESNKWNDITFPGDDF